MVVYQIIVKGRYKCFDNEFRCSSKNVYQEYPTEEIQQEFFQKCINSETPESQVFDMDDKQPYEIKVVELNVI